MRARMAISLSALMLAAGGTSAQSVPHIDASWPVVATDETDVCSGEVTGNGKFFKFSARGLDERQPAHLYVTNADMVPIDRPATVGMGGAWSEYYIPFLQWRDSGTVNVSLTGGDCQLNFTFNWSAYQPTLD